MMMTTNCNINLHEKKAKKCNDMHKKFLLANQPLSPSTRFSKKDSYAMLPGR